MRYRPTWGAACAVLLALAGCASTPEEDPVLQNKLSDLDTRITRIERVVSNNSLLQISNEMGDLRADLRAMHNDIDVLNHSLDASRKQQRDLYADLDQRLKSLEARSGGGSGAAAGGAASGSGAGNGSAVGGVLAGAGGSTGGDAVTGAGGASGKDAGSDAAAYQAAFALLKNSQYDQAIAAFQQFVATYPDSSLADNAHYWLGEAYYVNRDFTNALAAFQLVVDKYPQSRKVPDAMLKVGYCDYELKQWQPAKDVLSKVTANYPDTSAARLAQQRLDKMVGETH
jgi:tol-pal system protein YbgF